MQQLDIHQTLTRLRCANWC